MKGGGSKVGEETLDDMVDPRGEGERRTMDVTFSFFL